MTIEEARTIKRETEIEITKLIYNFSEKTNLPVEEIRYITEDLPQGRQQIVVLRLEVKL